jgi:hypothetical protein
VRLSTAFIRGRCNQPIEKNRFIDGFCVRGTSAADPHASRSLQNVLIAFDLNLQSIDRADVDYLGMNLAAASPMPTPRSCVMTSNNYFACLCVALTLAFGSGHASRVEAVPVTLDNGIADARRVRRRGK